MALLLPMSLSPPIRRRVLTGAAIFGVWTLAGVFFATQHHLIAAAANDDPGPLGERMLAMFVAMSIWAALTPFVAALADRFPLRRPHFWRNTAVSVVVAVAAAAVRAPIDILLSILMLHEPVPDPAYFVAVAIALGHPHLFFAMVVIGVANFLRLQRETAERLRAAAAARAELAHAKLRRLQSDLKPHFLFNSLNAVAELVHDDPAAAEHTLDTLSDLLRRSIAAEAAVEVPLAEELRLVEGYLDVQRTRFGNRLRTATSVQSPALLSCAIPPLLIQPLVENAVKHGVADRRDGGSVEVRVSGVADWLHVEVRDDGPGCDARAAVDRGRVGVPHAMARLQSLYGDRQSLSFRREDDAFIASLRLPLRVMNSEEPEHVRAH